MLTEKFYSLQYLPIDIKKNIGTLTITPKKFKKLFMNTDI